MKLRLLTSLVILAALQAACSPAGSAEQIASNSGRLMVTRDVSVFWDAADSIEGEPTATPPTPEPSPTPAVQPGAEPAVEPPFEVAADGDTAAPETQASEAVAPTETPAPFYETNPAEPLESNCAPSGGAPYGLIPFLGTPADRPDYLHGDLNFALRGYSRTTAIKELVNYDGETDSNAPQMKGLFADDRQPDISGVYRTAHWVWDPDRCGGAPNGCAGGLIGDWPVTVAGFVSNPGEPIHIPQRRPPVYPDGSIAMVLYADVNRITFVYTRDDSVVTGYAVHIEGICVDPELLALYRAQRDDEGWHVTGQLPSLKNDQPMGYALGVEIQLAIRDSGMFMDPRTRKDWWRGA